VKRVLSFFAIAALVLAACAQPTPGPTAPAAPAATVTLAPPGPPPSNCPHTPLGGFNDVWRNEQVYPRLGCAVAPAEAVAGTETYLCDGTHTFWLKEKRLFIAIPAWPYYPGQWRFVADESNLPDLMPLMRETAPRPQPCFPLTGRHAWLVSVLYPDRVNEPWARSDETPFSGALQQFAGGWLFWNGNVCFVLFADGSYIMF
jgi:hypothetical protein